MIRFIMIFSTLYRFGFVSKEGNQRRNSHSSHVVGSIDNQLQRSFLLSCHWEIVENFQFSFSMMASGKKKSLTFSKAREGDIFASETAAHTLVSTNEWLLMHSNGLFRTKIAVAMRA